MTTLPFEPLFSNTSPPRCEKAINVVGLLPVLLPLIVIVQGAYGVVVVSANRQVAPGATLVQLELSTDTFGQDVLSVTPMLLAFKALLASLVTTRFSDVNPSVETVRFCWAGPVILINGWTVTAAYTLALLVLSPLTGMMVGPTWVVEANVIVQLAPIARLLPQVVL